MFFIDRLLDLMKMQNVSAYRLSKDLGLSDSLISKWQKKPDIDPSAYTVYRISEYFQVSIEWLLTGKGEIQKSSVHTYEQTNDPNIKELINCYLALEKEDKIRTLERIRTIAEIKGVKESNLPATELAPVIDIKKHTRQVTTDKKRGVKVFELPASAGIGNYILEDDLFETMTFDADAVPAKTDFGIRISGDSMEPVIHSGDIVWVKEQVHLENGQIGIFIYEGEAYCKKLRIDHKNKSVLLESLNPEYKPIKITDSQSLKTVGKVLL